MSQSPFQNLPAIESDEAPAPPVRRLLSPAERFQAGEIARETENLEATPFDETDAEREEPAAPPDPFQPLAGTEEIPLGNRRSAQAPRERRRLKPHSPSYHEKKPHTVAHKPVKAAPESEPQNDWDRAAQNSMARAALARKRNRVRRIVGRVFLAGFVLFSVWCGAMALTAPQFEVHRIDISGTQRTSLAQLKTLTGQLVGKNIFRAPRSHVEEQVEAIATVKAAHLARVWSWPPHMTLQITERQPILQVGAGTTWWVADAQGVAYRRADRADNGLYQLTSSQFKPATGKPLPTALWQRARELQAALAADNALVARENGGANGSKFWDLRRVYLDENGAASLRVGGAGALKAHAELLIRLGEEGWPAKLKQARVALAYFERTGRRASELDLVSGEHPRWRPKATKAATDESTKSQDLTVQAQN